MSYYPDWCKGREKLACVDGIDGCAVMAERPLGHDENEREPYGGVAGLERLVSDIISSCPMASLDRTMLYGIVFENILGHFRASHYTLSYCMEHPSDLSLPTTKQIDEALRRAVRAWGER